MYMHYITSVRIIGLLCDNRTRWEMTTRVVEKKNGL